jgi:hypothetical protein
MESNYGAAIGAAAMIALFALDGSAGAMQIGDRRDHTTVTNAVAHDDLAGVVALKQVLGRVKSTVLQADQQAQAVVALLEKIEREYL